MDLDDLKIKPLVVDFFTDAELDDFKNEKKSKVTQYYLAMALNQLKEMVDKYNKLVGVVDELRAKGVGGDIDNLLNRVKGVDN